MVQHNSACTLPSRLLAHAEQGNPAELSLLLACLLRLPRTRLQSETCEMEDSGHSNPALATQRGGKEQFLRAFSKWQNEVFRPTLSREYGR